MSRPRTRRTTIVRSAGIAALAGVLLAPVAALAQSPEPVANPQEQLGLSLVGGLALPGTIDYSSPSRSFDTKVGFVARAAGDAMIVPKLSLGAYALFGSTSFEGGTGATIWGFGLTIKGHFRIQSIQLRGGLAVAFQLESADVAGAETSKGFGIAPVLEAAIPIASTLNLLVHASFISQPAGGNSSSDVTWAPIVYFAAGLEFVK